MRDKPKSGMRQKPKEHKDVQQDKKVVKKMVKKSCIK